ncbi:MAG TPA: serine/threonine-protein kinase [Kofleriaceae bacterium]|nr:serine/threonine-protein kinase [Kofleriaceae bacterium]
MTVGRNSDLLPPAALSTESVETRRADPRSPDPLLDPSHDPSHDPLRDLRPLIGSQLRDPARYHIMGEHGRGGLGRVSRAHDRELGRDVAIKELISRGHVDEVRFLREALITARLEHPGIVPVHEAGRWPDGTPFYAMKLVSGRSLRDLIAESTTNEQRLGLLDHVIAVADAIAYAHGRNIIHRDLKPANVIIGEFGETVVIDWGLAKDLSVTTSEATSPGSPSPSPTPGDDDLTVAGSVLGTPAYMAPEQGRGEQVDQRADVFAIGTMLWELCAARRMPPATADERHRMLRRAGIDRDLATILNKALDPDPARRYRDAGALAADLKAFKSGVRIAARSYSLFAMLAHWTRRHRALAISVTLATALAVTGVVLYVRNVASARDRADTALVSAQRERDRALLSEASLLLEKDPTRARGVLASLVVRSPQYALLSSRAQQLSAVWSVPVAAGISAVSRATGGATVEVATLSGKLHRLDPRTGVLTTVDHDVTGPVAYRGGRAVYARWTLGGAIGIATPAQLLDASSLTSVTRLVALDDAVYALDSAGDLHRFGDASSTIVAHGVNNIAGDGAIRMVCRATGELEVMRGEAVVLRRKCPATKSPAAMAAVGGDFVAITQGGTLTASRGGRQVEIPTEIRGEYELALSSQGVIAVADYSGTARTWFVPPGGTALVPGPVHTSQPYSVAADGNLAAWGYTDGTVIAVDATTGTRWRLRGHADAVIYVVIDAATHRLVSASDHELRIWELRPPASSEVKAMPCASFHLQPSPGGDQAALDCDDGSVWRWTRDTGAVTQVHKHAGASYGVEWIKDMICSGGWGDGRVLCTNADGTSTRVLDSGASRITWVTATPDHAALIYGSTDGKVRWFDGELRELYARHGIPYRMAVSADGRWLATCALDGSLTVFDLVNRQVIEHLIAHPGATYDVSWVDGELWTSGDDGTLKHWDLRDGVLTLRHSVQTPAAIRLLRAARGGWAASVGEGVLLVSRDGSSFALRLDLGRKIDALEVSPDLRYVVAAVSGELVVVDMQAGAIATPAIGSAVVQQVSFLDPTLVAFSEPTALQMLRVDHLDYVSFQPAPEPHNKATF